MAAAITLLVAATGRTFARWSKATVAKPIVPSLEIALVPAAYGLITDVTCGRRATWPSIRSTRARTAGAASVPCGRVQHDLVRVARLRREPAREQVRGPLRVGAGQREVVPVVAADGVRDPHRSDEHDDPERDHERGGDRSTSERASAFGALLAAHGRLAISAGCADPDPDEPVSTGTHLASRIRRAEHEMTRSEHDLLTLNE